MSADVWFVIIGLAAATLALAYYTAVEIPLREQRRLRQSLSAFSKAIELRFPSHAGLTKRVAVLSVHVGREMGLESWQLNDLEMAAWLRDIGLASIPYRLLNQKRPMEWSDADHATYGRHPEISAAMLELIPGLRRIAPLVRSHHACFDGTSGPYFPHGEDLPIESRILKVISDYVWIEKAQGHLLAREALRDGAGQDYDPAVVQAFVGLIAARQFEELAEPIAIG